MRKLRKILSGWLIFCMVLSMLPLQAMAEELNRKERTSIAETEAVEENDVDCGTEEVPSDDCSTEEIVINDDNAQAAVEEVAAQIVTEAQSAQSTHSHPVCYKYCSCGSSHGNVSWEPLPADTTTLSSGHYYLEDSVTFTSSLDRITITGPVSLCLNGKTLTQSTGSHCISVKGTGYLTICDCAGGGKITNTKVGISGQDCIGLYDDSSMSVYGGTINGAQFDAILCDTTGDLEIFGGNITAASSCINLDELNDLTITSGTLKATSGSGINGDYATFRNITISGGWIEGEACGIELGKVTCTGKIQISGGTLYGKGPVPNGTHYAGHYYGFSFMGGEGNCPTIISGGKLYGAQGGIYTNNSLANITVSGGTIGTLNTSTSIYATRSVGIKASYGHVQIDGGKIYGIDCDSSGRVTVTDGEILSIYVNSTASNALRVYGGTIGCLGNNFSSVGIYSSLQNPSTPGTIQIYRGTIMGTEYAIRNYSIFKYQISGGTLDGGTADISVRTTDKASDAYLSLKDYSGDPLTISVSSSAQNGTYVAKDVSKDGLVTITGNTFSALYDQTNKAVKLLGAHTHSYGTWTSEKPATCSAVGTKGYKDCSICYKHFDADGNELTDLTLPIDSSNHANTTDHPQQDATCKAEGYTAGTFCNDCSTWISGHEVIPGDHSWQDATCTAPKTCTVCGLTEGEPLDHTEETIPGKAATCTEDGLTDGKKCTVCGEVLVPQMTIPAAHNVVNDICIVCEAYGNCGSELTWSFDKETGTLTISGSGRIPSYTDAAYQPWYRWSEKITNLVIEDGVTSIGSRAFNESYALIHVELPETLTTIYSLAFADCESLEKIILPDSVTKLWINVFEGCKALQEVKLPAKITAIPSRLFSDCSSLTAVEIPDTVVEIGGYAFYGCTALTSIHIPDSVTILGNNAFMNCEKLQEVTLSSNIKKISYWSFRGCTSLESIVLPDGVTRIEEQAFAGCRSLTEITIPDSVTGIGESAFSGCSSLTTVDIPEGVTSIAESVFHSCTSLTSVSIPDTVTSIGRHAFYDCRSLSDVEIPDGVTDIGEYAFYNCKTLTNADIPEGVTGIGKYTFFRCENLTSVNIPDSVASIGEDAFYGCSKLEAVNIPEGVTIIEKNTFSGCNLTTLEIPSTVVSIAAQAFGRNDSLRELYFKGNCCEIADTAFSSCQNVTAYYPSDNATWTEDAMLNYGGSIIWKPYCYGDHTIVEDAAVEGNCTENGLTAGSHCSACGEIIVKQEIIAAPGHDVEMLPGFPATCTEDGLTDGSTCTVCKTILMEQEVITAPGHTGELIPGTPATCTEDGLTAGKKCSVCKEILDAQEIIEAPGHSKETISGFPATCTADGLTDGIRCTVCEETLTAQEVIKASGHVEKTVPGSPATCTANGLTDGVMCSVCGNMLIYHEVIEAKGHTEEIIPGRPATCTENGLTYGIRCSVCKQTLVGHDVIKAFGHNERDLAGKPATCTENGISDGKQCLTCGTVTVIQTVIPKLDHKETVLPAVAATCTSTGLTEGRKCDVCQEVLVKQETIEAYGHQNELIQGRAATCTEEGLTDGHRCVICKEITEEPESIPATGHTKVIDKKVEATCGKDGKTEGSHCSVCGYVIQTQTTIKATGNHTYDDKYDAKCNVCGFTRQAVESVPMFRMYDPNSSEHFYTGSTVERDDLIKAGWNYEGVGFNFPKAGSPVHRLYEPKTGEHLYTMDEKEMNTLLAAGWNYEGVAFNSADPDDIPQYRLHNPNATRGAYHFTSSTEERDMLISIGWELQGIGWYSCLK